MGKMRMRMTMRESQKTSMSFRTKLIIGTSCCLSIALGLFVTFNVTDVHQATAGTSGGYRSLTSGNWEDAASWEMYNGIKWQPALRMPVNCNRIFIKEGTVITVNGIVNAVEVTIEKGGTLKMNNRFFHLQKNSAPGKMNVYGTLDAGNCIIDGDASFNLNDNAEIIIGSPAGISKSFSGNIQVSGMRNYSSLAQYTYRSYTKQHCGKGLPVNVSKLVIDNPSGAELDNNLCVTSLLHLKKGILTTGPHTLITGTSVSKTGELNREEGSISGNLERWIGKENSKEVLFPVIENTNYNAVFITVNKDDYAGGTFTFNFKPGTATKNPVTALPGTRIFCISETGYYTMTAGDGLQNAVLKLVSSVAVSKHENKSYWMVKADKVDTREKTALPVEVVEVLSDISIVPNPFKEKFTAKFNLSKPAEVTIELVNTNGQLVYREKINGQILSNTFEFTDNKGLSSGNYFLNIRAFDKTSMRKLVKQ